MTKARDLANLISTGNPLADGALAASEVSGLHAVATSGAVADVTGAAPLANPTFTGGVNLGDNVVAKFGASNDLQIYHDGSNSYIGELGTGDLVLQTDGAKVGIASSSPFEWMMEANTNGAVSLYHDGSAKFATTSTGADVTGLFNTDNLTINGAQGTNGQVLSSTGSGVGWADAGGGTHSFITKIEVTTRNSPTLTMGSSYITSAYEDYYWELIVPNNGWAAQDDYTNITMFLQYGGGSYSGPYSGKLYYFRPHTSVGYEGNGTGIADSFKAYATGTGGNKVQVNHFKGTLISTQDLAIGARVMSEGTYYHSPSSNQVRTLHTATYFADGTTSYKITGLRMTATADFPVGTKLYLYGINRS